jgi:predicted short-subunit dehydrogenase-like oxidoreductase (DUF2520 family)
MADRRGLPPLTVVGAGRLAGALVPALVHGGVEVERIVARRPSAARRIARRAGGIAVSPVLARAAEGSGSVLLAVSDRAIGEVAAALARVRPASWTGRVVLHAAGALGTEPLAPLVACGARPGVLHPLQCLGDTDDPVRLLAGAGARIEGHARAREVAGRLARAAGLVVLGRRDWDAAARATYHAAAALASNDVVALLGDAVDLLRRAGLSHQAALAALLRLTRGTLDVVAAAGVTAALTGPAARGDAATLRAHARPLRALSPDAASAHRALSRRLRERARRRPAPRWRAGRRPV